MISCSVNFFDASSMACHEVNCVVSNTRIGMTSTHAQKPTQSSSSTNALLLGEVKAVAVAGGDRAGQGAHMSGAADQRLAEQLHADLREASCEHTAV